MYQVGIDIGSSAAKVAVIENGQVIKTILLDTGFSSRKVAENIYSMLEEDGITKEKFSTNSFTFKNPAFRASTKSSNDFGNSNVLMFFHPFI